MWPRQCGLRVYALEVRVWGSLGFADFRLLFGATGRRELRCWAALGFQRFGSGLPNQSFVEIGMIKKVDDK